MKPYSNGELAQMEQAGRNAERCVCCGAIIPEGRQVCPVCDVTGPIEVIKGKVRESFENGVLTVLQDIDIKVDKARLIRALELDKKVRNGELVEVVRCRDCEYWDPGSPMATVIPTPCRCRLRREDYGMTAEDFCSYGRRKEKTDDNQ